MSSSTYWCFLAPDPPNLKPQTLKAKTHKPETQSPEPLETLNLKPKALNP